MKMERNSSIELLRIVAMLMIVLLHTNFFSLGIPNYEDIISKPLATFWRILAEQICIIGVNVFVLISGWFGIRPSAKGLCSLLYQVLFWGLSLTLLGVVLRLSVPFYSIVKVFWFGSYYWFVVSYIGLYVISPVLNSFIETSSTKLYIAVLICFFTSEFIFGWVTRSETYSGGYSTFSFIGLYLLARYIRIHSRLKSIKPAYTIILFVIMTIIPAIISFVGCRLGWHDFHSFDYTSPFVIAAAAFFFLFFSKIEFSSRFINQIARSTFSVYIIHLHPVIIPYFISLMVFLSETFSVVSYSIVVFFLAMVFLLICTILDKTRIISWNFLYSQCLDSFFNRLDKKLDRIVGKLGIK